MPPVNITCPECRESRLSTTFNRHWSQKHRGVPLPHSLLDLFELEDDIQLPDHTGLTSEIADLDSDLPAFFDDEPLPEGNEHPNVRLVQFPGAGTSRRRVILTIGLPNRRGNRYIHPLEEFRKERETVCEGRIYFPYENVEQYDLARAMTNPCIQNRTLIDRICVKGTFLKPDVAFASVDDFLGRLDSMKACYTGWVEKEVRPIDGDVSEWGTPRYWCKDALAVLQEILENPFLNGKCVWAPVREFNEEEDRIYTDMHSGDWWWEMQVPSSEKCTNCRLN
jgi:Plavaka transposase